MSSLGSGVGGGGRGALGKLQEARERREKLQNNSGGGGSNANGSVRVSLGGGGRGIAKSNTVAGLMSRPQVPLRVNFFNNGSTSGKRCVLDRAQSLAINLPAVARRLGVFDFSAPVVYTSGGIRVDSLDEVIEGENLYFEAHGGSFKSNSINPDAMSARSAATVTQQSLLSSNSPSSSPSTTPSYTSYTSGLRRRLGNAKGGGTVTSRGSRPRANSLDVDFQIKFILVGNTAVGKSALLHQFTEGIFRTVHEATICVDFASTIIDINGRSVKCQIWDTAGQEDFVSITRAYYREAAAALLVYDVTDRASFNSIKSWYDRVREHASSSEIALCLVANKTDLGTKGVRAVPRAEGEALARAYQLMYVETSAQTGENVRQAFQQTASAVLRKVDMGIISVVDGTHGVRKGLSAADGADGGDDDQEGLGTPRSAVSSQRNKRISLFSSDGASESCCF